MTIQESQSSGGSRNPFKKYAPESVIIVFGVLLFLFTMIANPQTLLWLGLVQLNCDLPAHSKCVATGPIFDAKPAAHNLDIIRMR